MRPVRLAFAAVFAAAIVVGPVTTSTAAEVVACTWKSSPLPLPAGVRKARATASDNDGGYAGNLIDGISDVVLWKNGKVIEYGQVPAWSGYGVFVTDVNRSGVIVGYSAPTMRGGYVAFRSVGTKIEHLPVPAGTYSSTATGVNDRGDIVGHYNPAFGERARAVLWPADRPGQMVELTGLPTGNWTNAQGVDEDGTVLVVETTSTGSTNSFLWGAGVVTKLVAPVSAVDVNAHAISAGRVVGSITLSGGGTDNLRAVEWDAAGNGRVLSDGYTAESVNRHGVVVGLPRNFQPGALVWRGGTLDARIPEGDAGQMSFGPIGDDGGIPATLSIGDITGTETPMVFRCS